MDAQFKQIGAFSRNELMTADVGTCMHVRYQATKKRSSK